MRRSVLVEIVTSQLWRRWRCVVVYCSELFAAAFSRVLVGCRSAITRLMDHGDFVRLTSMTAA